MSTLWTSSRHLATITRRHLHVRASARPMGVHNVIRARAVRARGQSRALRAPARARGAAARRRSIGPDPPAPPCVRPASLSRLSVAWRRSGHPMRPHAHAGARHTRPHGPVARRPAAAPAVGLQPVASGANASRAAAEPKASRGLEEEGVVGPGRPAKKCSRCTPPPVRRQHRELARDARFELADDADGVGVDAVGDRRRPARPGPRPRLVLSLLRGLSADALACERTVTRRP